MNNKDFLISELRHILPESAINILLYSETPQRDFQSIINVYGGLYVRFSFWSIFKMKLIGQKWKLNSPALLKIACWLKENREAAEKNGRSWPPIAYHGN